MTAQATKTYRGASLEELLPRIREELGEDAIVTRQREGIVGGIGGFFGKRCVEVEACAAWAADLVQPSVPPTLVSEAYAEPDESELVAAVAGNPLIQGLIEQSTPFAEQLTETMLRRELEERDALTPEDVLRGHAPPPREAPAGERPKRPAKKPVRMATPRTPSPRGDGELLVAGAREALVRTGLPETIVDAVVHDVLTHIRPFAPNEPLTTQIRRGLAARLRVEHVLNGTERTIALVGASGAGRTSAVARLCRAYASAGLEPLAVALGPEEEARRLAALLGDHVDVVGPAETPADAVRALQRHGGDARLVVVDTPPVSPADSETLAHVAGLVRAVSPDEVHVVVSATTASASTAALLDALRPVLCVDRMILTRLDEAAEIGQSVGIALEHGLPISFVASGREPDRGLRPADPIEVARLLLP
jgi:flagellar biosynthesis protein FlhF